MKKIQRNKNVINGLEDLEYLYKFDSFPVFMGCMGQPKDNDILANVNLSSEFWG